MEKKNKIIIVVAVIALVLLALGTTYAYFTANITGGESASTIITTGGRMTITYADLSGNIEVNNIYPRNAAWVTKEFTVTGTNTTDLKMNYKIGLQVDINTFTAGALTYNLTSTNTSNNGIAVSSKQNISIENNIMYFGAGQFLKGTSNIHTYKFELFFKDSGKPQNDDQKASFAAHIIIEEAGTGDLPKFLKDEILAQGYDNLAASYYTIPGQEVATTDEGIRTAQDDYGTSYYYRGAVEDNYVQFANKCWRIVRVTGNGAIKLVLYNDNPNNVVSPCGEEGGDLAFSRYDEMGNYTCMFSVYGNYNAGIGLMYGDINGTTYDAVHANNTDSTILTSLKSWYDLSFTEAQKSMLADTIWCNDKSLSSGTGIGTSETEYGAYSRLYSTSTANPSLICPNTGSDGKLSKFTASDTTYGNGKLRGVNGVGTNEYKVGLLTPDEVAFAGSIVGENNFDYFLYKNTEDYETWWLSAASGFYGYHSLGARVWYVAYGTLNDYMVDSGNGVRGVVSLKSNTAVSGGTGTYDDPFVVNG